MGRKAVFRQGFLHRVTAASRRTSGNVDDESAGRPQSFTPMAATPQERGIGFAVFGNAQDPPRTTPAWRSVLLATRGELAQRAAVVVTQRPGCACVCVFVRPGRHQLQRHAALAVLAAVFHLIRGWFVVSFVDSAPFWFRIVRGRNHPGFSSPPPMWWNAAWAPASSVHPAMFPKRGSAPGKIQQKGGLSYGNRNKKGRAVE